MPPHRPLIVCGVIQRVKTLLINDSLKAYCGRGHYDKSTHLIKRVKTLTSLIRLKLFRVKVIISKVIVIYGFLFFKNFQLSDRLKLNGAIGVFRIGEGSQKAGGAITGRVREGSSLHTIRLQPLSMVRDNTYNINML